MSTDHSIFIQKRGHHEVEMFAYEQSCEFTVLTSDGVGSLDQLQRLSIQDLSKLAFRLLEVVSYYDPDFEQTGKDACSDYTKEELRRFLK